MAFGEVGGDQGERLGDDVGVGLGVARTTSRCFASNGLEEAEGDGSAAADGMVATARNRSHGGEGRSRNEPTKSRTHPKEVSATTQTAKGTDRRGLLALEFRLSMGKLYRFCQRNQMQGAEHRFRTRLKFRF